MSFCISFLIGITIWVQIEFNDLDLKGLIDHSDRFEDKLLIAINCFEIIFNSLTFINDLLLLLQALEWSVMIYFMKYQDEKTLSSIIQHMSNTDTRKAFVRGERIIVNSFILIMVLLFLFTLLM